MGPVSQEVAQPDLTKKAYHTRLVAHMLNVDPKAKPVAQPARIFHTEIEGKIIKEV